MGEVTGTTLSERETWVREQREETAKARMETQEQATRRKREILKNVKRGPREENDYRD
jgi:hypothetical protein